jgi:hypothetical protein
LSEKVQRELFDLQRKGGYLMKNISGHCPVCRSKILEGGTNCPSCETPHHKECWEYNNGKCAIFACRPVSQIVDSTQTRAGLTYNMLPAVLSTLFLIIPLLGVVMVIISADLRSVYKDEVVVTDSWVTNPRYSVLNEGRLYYPFFNTNTHYKKKIPFYFSTPIPFCDGIRGNISGTVEYKLPDSLGDMESLHINYGSQAEIHERLIKKEVISTLIHTGRMMTADESYKDRGAKFQRLFSDQMQNGNYVVMLGDGLVTNPITRKELRIETIFPVTRPDGSKIRDVSGLQHFGITVSKASVDIGYPQEFLDVMYDSERVEIERMREAQEVRMKRRANRKIIADAIKYLQTFF